jgi:hypothetical protein
MPRSKKSSAGQPPPDQHPPDSHAHESAENEGMAHVDANALEGSPDVFAPKKDVDPVSEDLAAPVTPPEAADEPMAQAPETVAEPEPPAVEETSAPLPEPPVATIVAPPSPFAPAPPGQVMTAPPPPERRGGAGVALGVVLVVVGAFYLLIQLFAIDLSSYGWPLFVIIPGLTLLIVGFVSLGTGAAIPGGILTMVGLVLAYQSSTGDWASWAYAWALVAPGGVGLGLFLQGLRERDMGLIKQGRSLMFIAALIFLVGFVFFESVLNISGINDRPIVKAALPALFIVIGIILLGRSIRNSRRA